MLPTKKYPFLFAGLLLGVLLAACSRDREAIPGKQYQNAFPLAVGNYWVYRTTITSSTGEKQIFDTVDSVWIEKDTTINGKRAFVQRRTMYYPTLKTYLSDSADCIVSKTLQYRSIEFSTNFRDTLERQPPFYLMMLDANAETQVEAGIFRTVNCKSLVRRDPSDQDQVRRNWPLHDPIFMIAEQKLYANNVGLVRRITYGFGNTIEEDLVRYKIR